MADDGMTFADRVMQEQAAPMSVRRELRRLREQRDAVLAVCDERQYRGLCEGTVDVAAVRRALGESP